LPSAPSASGWGSKISSFYGLTFPELSGWLAKKGQPSYRARQIYEALYQKGKEDPAEWTTLPKPLREEFAREFSGPELEEAQAQVSADGTAKRLWKLLDGSFVETVMIPVEGRRTVCVSSQVGCAYRCTFCASGMEGLTRNLSAGEIVEQVVRMDRFLKPDRVTHIVFMGMGEPLSNYSQLLQSIRILNAPEGLKIGARKITISSVGLVPMIEKLAQEDLQVELSISLHAPNDGLRGKIMPVNRKHPMVPLLAACKAYVKHTKRLITFEYILIDALNDQPEHAEELAGRLKGLLCKVNLIPCHPVPGASFGRPPMERMAAFEKILREKGITCTLRQSRGLDIEGACGQLRLHHETSGPRPLSEQR